MRSIAESAVARLLRTRTTLGLDLYNATAAAAAGYISYFGRYEIDAERGVVTHHVEGALSQHMLGRAMPRWFELSPDGETLYLSTKNGDRVTGRLRWDRHK